MSLTSQCGEHVMPGEEEEKDEKSTEEVNWFSYRSDIYPTEQPSLKIYYFHGTYHESKKGKGRNLHINHILENEMQQNNKQQVRKRVISINNQ